MRAADFSAESSEEKKEILHNKDSQSYFGVSNWVSK